MDTIDSIEIYESSTNGLIAMSEFPASNNALFNVYYDTLKDSIFALHFFDLNNDKEIYIYPNDEFREKILNLLSQK